MTLWSRIFKPERAAPAQRARFSQPEETEATLALGASLFGGSPRDRLSYSRQEMLAECLLAWRINPLARRLVTLTSQYVIGDGLKITCKHPATNNFIHQVWQHPLNRLATRTVDWCDELTRSGNLFILVSTDGGGMSYLRAVPAAEIDSITSRPNDIEQPLLFQPRAGAGEPLMLKPPPYRAYDPANDPQPFAPVMLHYTINRPVGAQWGESDLAPVLRWLSRYANWLEDRARLNRFRNTFVYVVSGRFTSERERQERQRALHQAPPTPGAILVKDDSEHWEVLAPKLESDEAAADGLALKKMIAAGCGVPLHFLAEPESATRTTAEAAGGPAYRAFEQRQQYFTWLVADILNVCIRRRRLVLGAVRGSPSPEADVHVHGADISARDNASLAGAAADMAPVLCMLRDRCLIDDEEFLRLLYRFSGEALDPAEMLARAAAPPTPATPAVSPEASR
ncbi:MAG: hypothetical protein HPY76_00955 [Anaerolineae bacterium]|nr:hypothetical protein [Anaerolineae bacterium]